MNTEKLFRMQKGLDSHIETQHGLSAEDLFDRKVLALMVEVGELANETRCFKFWSVKPPSEKNIILEEFVDGIHFILSLGIEAGLDGKIELKAATPQGNGASSKFLEVYAAIGQFRETRSEQDYLKLFGHYLELGQILGLDEAEIEQAYIEKNEVNYERQQKGY